MIWLVLTAHVAGVMGLIAIGSRLGIRQLLSVAAVPPAFSAGWAFWLLASDARPRVSEVAWVEALDLTLRFRTGPTALMMALLVSGIGVLVFTYAAGYFGATAAGGARFAAALLGFSGSMLGLVLADSVWTLFIFWELTSVTSFLLVGHKSTDAAVLAAARRALMITGGGGLALLAGLLVLADAAGTTVLSELPAVTGTAGSIAAVLVLLGAATKSAQVPFHVWLPGAMAAPTPVSAYLHSATMVKAGVVLLALTGSAFAEVAAYRWVGLAFGVVSTIWGGIGALRHRDAKLILAWGTVSQLGLLVTLLSVGSGKAVFAAVSILFAHALFKAALFCVVGEVDIRTRTRNIDELGGLHRSMPVTFWVALLASMSMAGVPPLLGFAAKEAAVEAVLKLGGTELIVAGIGVIGGSILTVAYTTRFLLGVFGSGPATEVAPRRLAMTVPAVILSGAGLIGFVALGVVNGVVGPAATELNAAAGEYSLLRWPGFSSSAFQVSIGIIGAGAAFGNAVSRRRFSVPTPVGASRSDQMLDGTLTIAHHVTARIQHGSLPVYVAVMAATASFAALPFVVSFQTDHLFFAENAVQAGLAIAILVAAFGGAFVGSRLGAALTLGAVGLGVSGLFLEYGAPDLALTQLLVETIIVVGFVMGLGHLAHRFPPVSDEWRALRLAISALGGLVVMIALVASGSSPVGEPPVAGLAEGSVEDGGGNNVVNVILTDIRALDTLGEVVVLATVAVGILALANVAKTEASSGVTT